MILSITVPEGDTVLRNKEQLFPLGDWVPDEQLKRIFGHPEIPWSFDKKTRLMHQVCGQWTGEKRPPREDEWFLSGGPIQAYRAYNDLSDSFPIARLVWVETKTITIIHEPKETHS